MLDLLLPRTDAGVATQLAVVVSAGIVALVALRRRPDARLLVSGMLLAALGGIGLRVLH